MSSQLEDAFNEAMERRAAEYEQRIGALRGEVNDLRDQVQMYEEKAERDWRDFGEMQDARIAADDRVVELEKELARVCKQLDSANDMVERARSLAHRSRCEGYDEARAASPDERLREAGERLAQAVARVCGEGHPALGMWRVALAAADREAPDEPGVWPDQSAVHGVLLDQIKDAYAEGIADTVAKIRGRAAEVLPEVARFTLDEIETICADRAVEQRVVYRVRDRSSDYKAMCHEDRDHAELLLKAWLADGRDAVIESRVVYDAGWKEER